MIAECIEFDEETPQSHKTWKTKPYDIAEFKDIIYNSTEWDVKSDYNSLILRLRKKYCY